MAHAVLETAQEKVAVQATAAEAHAATLAILAVLRQLLAARAEILLTRVLAEAADRHISAVH